MLPVRWSAAVLLVGPSPQAGGEWPAVPGGDPEQSCRVIFSDFAGALKSFHLARKKDQVMSASDWL